MQKKGCWRPVSMLPRPLSTAPPGRGRRKQSGAGGSFALLSGDQPDDAVERIANFGIIGWRPPVEPSVDATPPAAGAAPISLRDEQTVPKNWDRRPKRRGFDDDDYAPPPLNFETHRSSPASFQAPSGPPTTGIVKWYKADKGFGFVQLADGSGDAFLHASVLERSGNRDVAPGATLEIRVAPGSKGPQVAEVISVDSSTAQEPARQPRPERPAYGYADSQPESEELGSVKFYAGAKGFGFITRDSGGKDAFVHVSALKRAGIPDLAEGQRVAMTVRQGTKGPEVVTLRLA
jgi:CspA family cold shock protein